MWLLKSDKNPILAKASYMKKSVKPLFSILVLIVFAATLSYRTALRRGLVISFQLDGFAAVPVFNSTLLRLASADPNLERNKQEITKLLDGNFNSLGRYRLRSYSNWRRYNRLNAGPNRGTRHSYQAGLQSPAFYRYWLDFRKHLQNWWRKKNFEPDVMLEMVNLVKGAIESSRMSNGSSNSSDSRYLGEASKKYSSCAVVGNSGILLKNEHGDLIDSHEFVIRLNNARIETFGKNVGTKTSISFVNSNILNYCARREGCFCHPYGANVPIIMYVCQAIHFFDYTLCEKSHKAPLLITDPRFDVLCARIIKYYSLKRFVEETGKPVEEWDSKYDVFEFHYSSGMQAVMLALGICDKVSLFGFGKSDSAKHHYHTNQKAELKLHDYEAEYSFYRDAINRSRAIPFISDKFKFPPMVMYQ